MEEGAAAAAGRPTSHSARKIGNKQQGRRMEWGGEEAAYLDRSSRETRGRRRRPSDLTRREKKGKLPLKDSDFRKIPSKDSSLGM